MSPYIILLTILAYVAFISLLGYLCGRGADNMGFFIGGRATSWWKATLAMIGAAMSGVTFISVPGSVAADGFSYFIAMVSCHCMSGSMLVSGLWHTVQGLGVLCLRNSLVRHLKFMLYVLCYNLLCLITSS